MEKAGESAPRKGFFDDKKDERAEKDGKKQEKPHEDEIPWPSPRSDRDDPFENGWIDHAVNEEGVEEVDCVAHHADGRDPAIGEGLAESWPGKDGEEGQDEDEGLGVEG